MKRLIHILLLVVIPFLSCNKEELKKVPPKALKGILDLRQWVGDPLSNTFPPINLDGEWEFYWNELLDSGLQPTAQQVGDPLSTPNYIPVPAQWQNHGYPSDGYATYRLRILLPDYVPKEGEKTLSRLPLERQLSIKMTDAGTSYEMYINGKLASVNGKVGKTLEESVPFFRYRHFSIDKFIYDFESDEGVKALSRLHPIRDKNEIEILIHVSNFHHFKAGLWDKIQIGSTELIEKEAKQKFGLDIAVFSCLLIMALYHFGLYLNRKKDLSALYFTALCSFFALRIPTINERMILDVFPDLPFFILFKLEYLSLYLGSYMFISFVRYLFLEEFSKKIYLVISVVLLSCSAIVLLFPMNIFTRTLIIVQVMILVFTVYIYKVSISAILHKRLGAKLFLIGFVLFMFAFVNDILRSMGYLGTPLLASYGLLTMVISQAIILSRRFAGGFDQAEKLSNELEQKSSRLEETSLELSALTQNLELKIEERTKDLEETKKEIEDLNTFSHLINSLSDLNSIFIEISKYFYHKFGITGVWLLLPDEKRKFLGAYKVYSYNKLPEDKYDYMMTKKIPLEENEGGVVYKNFVRKKPFYLSKIPKFEFEVDREIVEKLSLVSFLQVPLVRKEECVGVFFFSNFEKEMKLSKSDIQKISNLCYQIAGTVDTIHLLQQVEVAKTQADSARIEAEIERGISVIAKLEVEKAKKKTEDLNLLIKKVNEISDLEEIMKIILTYVKDNYHLPYYSLFTLDPKENVLKYANSIVPDYVTSEHKKMISSSVLSVTEKNMDSIHFRALALKTPIFIADAETEVKTKIGKVIQGVLKHKSFITLPIVLQNNSIGTLDFFSLEPLRLREEEITELSLLAEQLAGVIQGAILYTQVQEEKEKAITAREESEKQKKETEELNLLIKSLNEELDLKVILQKVLIYVNLNFGIQYYALYRANIQKTHVEMSEANFPTHMTEEDRAKILKFKISVQEVKGAHAFPFKAKRPFFIPRIKKTGATEEENFIGEKYKISSIFILPLILNNEIIGTIDFSSETKMELSKEDITKLSILGEQLAGIIHGSNLLKQVQEEKEKSEKAKQEIETLNEFTKLINSTSDISTIFKEIYSYLNRTFGFNNLWVLLVDKNKKELYSGMNTSVSQEGLAYDIDFFKNFRITLDEKLGTLYQTYTTAVPLYVADVSVGDIKTKTLINGFNGKTYLSSKTDLKINIKGKLKSLLQIPLILQNEVIGIVCLSIFDKLLELSHEEIEKLVRFSNQIAGVIHNAQLLKQTEEAKVIANIEKEKALSAQEETEKAKSQVEFLNEFSKVINSFNNLDIIFSHAVESLSNKIETDIFQLQLVDKEKNELFTRCLSGTDSGLMKKYNQLRVPLIPKSGSLYLTYISKETLYLKNVKRIRDNKKSELDNMVEKDFQIDSVFLIPLLVNDEVIGIMSINKFGGMKKLKADEVRFVESLCEQLALAVNNSFLLEETENARKETEGLNDLMRNINSVSSLVDIMSFIMYYLETEYNFKDFYLLLNEEKEKELVPFSFTSARHTEEEREYFLNSKIMHEDLQGVFADIFETKKSIFITKENLSSEDLIAKDWMEKGKFAYLFLLPIVIYDELIGILLVSSPKEIPFPSQEIRRKVERFSDMIAGSVFNARLLKKVEAAKEEADLERNKSEKLLLNILPKDVAAELKDKGFAEPELFENVSVMFTDFKGFTQIAETLTPQELIKDLDACFVQFDKITERVGLEKLKTIGDSYMCAGGIPKRNTTHAIDCCLAALEIQSFMNMMKKLKEEKGFPYWELRLGIHTGPLIAGVIGERKFAYDVWGDTVNTASRMESSGTPGKINISYSTYELVKEYFDCEYRGEVNAKNKGVVKMYYLHSIKPEFSKDEFGRVPNEKFWAKFSLL